MLETCDGFDTYNISQLLRRYPEANGTFSMSLGANGSGQALSFGDSARLPIPLTARSSYLFGINVWVGGLYSLLINIATPAGTVCSLSFNPAAGLDSTFGSSALTGIAVLNKWMQLQVKHVISATAGALVVKLDGVTLLDLAILNTGTNPITSIAFLTRDYFRTMLIDDFWVFNQLGAHSTDFPIGKMQVQRQTPSSDGAHQDLLPSSGPNRFAMVSDVISDDDATYVSGITPGVIDTYGVSPLVGVPSQIHGALITGIVRKDDVNPKTLHIVGQSGAVLAESADIDVPLNYAPRSLLLADDPNTGSQWTLAGINSLQPGAKIIL